MTQKQRPKKHGPSAASILCILGCIGLFLGFRMFLSGDFDKQGSYDGYAGPVLPLTAVSGGEGITASRHVDFDFSTYGETHKPNVVNPAYVQITDTYQLTNSTGEDQTVQLAYPALLQFIMEREFFPTVTVAGQAVQTEQYLTVDPDESFFRAANFEDYQKLMAEQDYLATALEEPVVAEIPVKAYHFTDISYTGDGDEADIYLTLEFSIPKGTNVWVRHYDVLTEGLEKNTHSVWFKTDLDEQDRAWLFVANGDIENLTIGGNRGNNRRDDTGISDVTCEYEIVETTFGELMWKFAQEYDFYAEHTSYANPGHMTPELLYRHTMKRIGGNMGKGYDPLYGAPVTVAEEKFYATHTQCGIQYTVFPVEIPAGEMVEVQISYFKESSHDFVNQSVYPEAYEIATQLGSNLTFTSLSAGIQNTQWINVESQNIGFDLPNGLTQVTLDPQGAHYYLEVLHKTASA